MFEADQGLSTSYWTQPMDPMQPYHRAVQKYDRRHAPKFGGGRRMRHPFLPPIVYPHNPDRTSGFDQDRLRQVKTITTKTLSSTVVSRFRDEPEDVVITEFWGAETLSTEVAFARQLYQYLNEPLPAGRYLGWQPRDRSWKNFFIELLSVQVGSTDEFLFEELGDGRPYLMREPVTVKFKLVREILAPVSAFTLTGA